MAKALKIGDLVTVREGFRLKQNSDGYRNGIKSLRPDMVGRVVDMGKGRSVVVDFDGKRATLSTQRLDRYLPPAESPQESVPKAAQESPKDPTAPIDYYNPHFIKMAANTLLKSGTETHPETVVVQIKLSELPSQVQKQVQALIEAKLDLGPVGVSTAPASRRKRQLAASDDKPVDGKRRGRKPKNAVS